MRIIISLLCVSFFMKFHFQPEKPSRSTYRWLSFENIPTDKKGGPIAKPSWVNPAWIPFASADTFVTYANNDSVLMITLRSKPQMFRKIQIQATKWKPKPVYGKELFFMGTYIARELGGLYFSFYSTKNKNALMQISYTNPGNMTMALLFMKDSSNILQKDGVVIDPRDEQPEAERMQVNLH